MKATTDKVGDLRKPKNQGGKGWHLMLVDGTMVMVDMIYNYGEDVDEWVRWRKVGGKQERRGNRATFNGSRTNKVSAS